MSTIKARRIMVFNGAAGYQRSLVSIRAFIGVGGCFVGDARRRTKTDRRFVSSLLEQSVGTKTQNVL